MLKQLNAIQDLSPSLIEYLIQAVPPRTIQRNKYLLHPGQVTAPLYFVESGLLRSYHDNHSREVSTGFWKENDWIITVESFFSASRAKENIKALEKTIVYPISDHQLQGICDRFPGFSLYLLRLVLQHHRLSLQLLDAIRGEMAKGRYNWLTEHLPDLPQRVSAKYLAPYIGITEEMLSMVKAGKKQ